MLLGSPALDVRLITALQVLQVHAAHRPRQRNRLPGVNVAIAIGAAGVSKAIATASKATPGVSKTAGAPPKFVMDTVVDSVPRGCV